MTLFAPLPIADPSRASPPRDELPPLPPALVAVAYLPAATILTLFVAYLGLLREIASGAPPRWVPAPLLLPLVFSLASVLPAILTVRMTRGGSADRAGAGALGLTAAIFLALLLSEADSALPVRVVLWLSFAVIGAGLAFGPLLALALVPLELAGWWRSRRR